MYLTLLDVQTETGELITRITLLILLPFLVAFSFIVFIIYRRNREGSLRRKQLELELRAIRAQMNPHFIFNCLNSIHYCIEKKESEKAGHYLLKFSYLTRRVLENSSKTAISLEEDLNMLKAYLELEQLRSGNRFKYSITIGRGIDAAEIAVPMLLLQPLVENAVWHGFDSRRTDGFIKIEIEKIKNEITMRVKDNGIVQDRFDKTKLPGKEISMGRTLIADQLNAITELQKRSARFETSIITDDKGGQFGMINTIYLPLNSIF
jgi:LytS/YehU family sensor histidine kinase